MKKAKKIMVSILLVVIILIANPFNASAAESQTLEQIYETGDYNVGSIYGLRLNRTELNQVAAAVLTFVESYDWTGVDDYTKVYYAHQYLCAICDYAPDWLQNGANTAWGALVYGQAQCSGYARAFKAMCDAMGIGCYYVHADENASNPSHQWNEVCVDGVWYIIDVQCNDSSGFPGVFLVSGETYARRFGMSWNHDGLPECIKDYGYGVREKTYYNADGSYRVVEHDGDRNWLKTTLYNADGTLNRYVVNEYDVNGKRVKEINCNADGVATYYTVYEYDGNANIVKETGCSGDGILHQIREYDGNGNCINEILYNADGTLQTHWVMEFNEEGNCLLKTGYHVDGTYETWEYTGRHVIKTTYSNGGTVTSKLDFNFEDGSVNVLGGDVIVMDAA